MTQMTPRRGTPLTNPFTLASVAAVLLFGPSDGNAAPAALPAPTAHQTGLLHGDAGPRLLAVFCSRSGPEFADYAPLLTPAR